jgi:hypothetical protein
MKIEERLSILFSGTFAAEIDQWVKSGREYAARLDRLPPPERESVAHLFACYGLSHSLHEKKACRAGIDTVIRPFYPGVDHAPTAS